MCQSVNQSWLIRSDKDFDLSSLAPPFDSFVTVSVQLLEIAPQFFLFGIICIGGKLLREACKSFLVKFVHVGFEIAKLRKHFTTVTILGVSTAIEFALIPLLTSTRI